MGNVSACPSKRVIIPGFLIAAGTRSREEKKERRLGGRNLLRSERAAWAGAPGERHRNVRSDSIWQGVPAGSRPPVPTTGARITGSLLCPCTLRRYDPCCRFKGMWHITRKWPLPLHCATPLNPPRITTTTTITTTITTTTMGTCPWRRPELVLETSPGVILSA